MAKKEKIVVWMSRDTKRVNYLCFWSKQPAYAEGEGRYNPKNKDKLGTVCDYRVGVVRKMLHPIKLSKRGLVKLTITAERIE